MNDNTPENDIEDDEDERPVKQRVKPSRAKTLFVTIVSVLFTLVIVGSIAVIAIVYYFGRDLPDYHKLSNYHPAGTTRVYAGDGTLIGEYAVQKRFYMPLEKIPRKVINAFVAAEDQNYYQHTGIDPLGIARAVLQNVKSFGEETSLVGGSTITQQVVKNFLLTREKSFTRKIKEALLAFRVTRVYSKNKILELYLNEIYLGMGAYGVVAAAETYFGKPLADLRTEEIALLAAMPKAPANYDPRYHYDRALKRRGYVLQRMAEDGYINREEADYADKQPIVITEREIAASEAEFFTEEVRRSIVQQYGFDQLYKGGLFVKTTLDTKLQKLAQKSLRDALLMYDQRHGYRGPVEHLDSTKDWSAQLKDLGEKYVVYDLQKLAIVLTVGAQNAEVGFEDGTRGTVPFAGMRWAQKVLESGRMGSVPKSPKDVVSDGDVIIVVPDEDEKTKDTYKLIQVPEVNGALVVLDPHSGRVLAMAGGYSPLDSEFNRATQAKRQPGSAFKPFVYLTAMEHGFTPASIVVDEPVELYQGPGLPLWRPKNYEGKYLGPTTLRVGLEKSRNVMTVRLAQMLGIKRIVKVAERLGIYKNPPANYSMVLGSAETTLLTLANAYGMIANGGMKITPQLVERIDDRNGTTIFRRDSRACETCSALPGVKFSHTAPPELTDIRERVIDERVAYQMVSMLQGVVQRGTAAAANKLGRPLAGKTGTTNDSRDAWFMGFSPDMVIGVYIGYDKPKGLGTKETGGRVALPAFMEVIAEALKDEPPKPFSVPPGIQLVQIDRSTGMPPIPGMEVPGNITTESFIFGGPIFIPEGEEEAVAGEGGQPEDGTVVPIDPNSAYQPMQYDAYGQPIDPAAQQQPGYYGVPSSLPQGYQQLQTPEDNAYPSDRYRNRIYRNRPRATPRDATQQPANVGTGALY